MNEVNKKKSFWSAVGAMITVFILGVGILYVSSFLVNKFAKPTEPQKPIEPIISKEILKAPECPQNFEAYKELVDKKQSIRLLSDEPSYAAEGKFVKSHTITISHAGEIGCGYLYVRASKVTGALDEKSESIFINPQNFGGHLLRPRGITIVNPVPDTTETLLPLNAIPYLPTVPYDSEAQNYKLADWVKMLNVSNEVEFTMALSVQDQSAKIEEVIIAYKCWNPNTGKETQDCQLGVK